MGKNKGSAAAKTMVAMFARKESALRTTLDRNTVKLIDQASMMQTPPLNADGHQIRPDAPVHHHVLPHGQVTIGQLRDQSVPHLNEQCREAVITDLTTGRDPPSRSASTSSTHPKKKKKRKVEERIETEAGGSHAPPLKKARNPPAWLSSTPYDPEKGKSGEITQFELPIYTPNAIDGYLTTFFKQCLTLGLRDED